MRISDAVRPLWFADWFGSEVQTDDALSLLCGRGDSYEKFLAIIIFSTVLM